MTQAFHRTVRARVEGHDGAVTEVSHEQRGVVSAEIRRSDGDAPRRVKESSVEPAREQIAIEVKLREPAFAGTGIFLSAFPR